VLIQTKALRPSGSDHGVAKAAFVPKTALGGQKEELQFVDQAAFRQAMQDLRSDPSNVNW